MMKTQGERYGYGVVLGLLLSVPLMAGGGSALGHPVGEDENGRTARINVRVYNYAQVPDRALEQGEKTAARVFRKAGIEVSWMNCNPAATDIELVANCTREMGPPYFAVRIVPRMAIVQGVTDGKTGGLAIGNLASVSFCRAAEEAAAGSIAPSELLGLVMAHELGHMLLGPSHSESGIMQAHWTREDLQHGPHGGFEFTPRQAQLIRTEVGKRGQEQAAVDGVSTTASK
jgi:hypothetical protein